MKKSWSLLTVFYFLITAISGVLMRSKALFLLPAIRYDHILHAHSHLALLGWVYMALVLLFLVHFFKDNVRNGQQIKWLYGLTQLTVIGMFISFSIQGYAALSISFSTIHILLSYWFIAIAWKQLHRQTDNMPEKSASILFAKGSLICLAVSSLGPWVLAALSANQLKETQLYDAAIYFYLHFQYNGWFSLGLMAVLLRIFEERRIIYSKRAVKVLFWMYTYSLLPSFLLSVLWFKLDMGWYVVAAIAAIVQWIAIAQFCVVMFQARSSLNPIFEGWAGRFLIFSLVILFVKVTLELGSAVPGLSALIYDSRSVVIGYLHLTLLGFVSLMCMALFIQQGWMDGKRKVTKIGYVVFLIGFGVNELVLFLQGLFDWMGLGALVYAREWLWAASVGMALGIFTFWIKGMVARG